MNIRLVALYKHWVTADSIKQTVGIPLSIPSSMQRAKDFVDSVQLASNLNRLSVWYALLQVVVEGYLKLDISDEQIDSLLAAEGMADSLRRFRNALFHFQEDPLSEKLLHFLTTPDSEIWVHQLNRAFEGFFRQHLPIDEYIASIRFQLR